jgi:hypothetical protein
MSPANACKVRLSELHSDCRVSTLDADFRRSRWHGGQIIPLLAPERNVPFFRSPPASV